MHNNTVPRVPAAVKIGALLATVVFLLGGAVDHLWGSSADLAHHYSLVARLSQLWTLPGGVLDLSLGEMNFYPRYSHMLAAALGMLVHSPLLGMQLVAQLSIMLAWTCMAALLLTLPRRGALAGAAVLGVLLVLIRRQLEIFGVENIGNFFFAQLLAQVMVIAALLAALLMERRGVAAPLRYIFLIAAIHLVTGTHVLPASQLVCALLAMIALDGWSGYRGHRARPAGRPMMAAAAVGLLCMLAAVLVLVKHPAFAAMRSIAGNDGSLTIHVFNSVPLIVGYCVLLAAGSAALIVVWLRMPPKTAGAHFLALKYVGLFGLAAAGLCLVQIVLLSAGQGSLYAVKKHLFTLNSVLLMELALLPVLLSARCRRQDAPAHLGLDLLHSTLLLPLLTAIGFLALTTEAGGLDTSKLVALEHKLELRRALGFPATPGRSVYVTDLADVPPFIDYMLGLGVYSAPRLGNSMNVLAGQPFGEASTVGTVITGAGTTLGKMTACRLAGSDGEIAVLDGACAMKQLAIGRAFIGMSTKDDQPNCKISGFSVAEDGGRWTDARQAMLTCPLPRISGAAPKSLTLLAQGFTYGGRSQRLQVRLNGGAVQEFTFEANKPAPAMELTLPAHTGEQLEISLNMPDAVSPTQLGIGSDNRVLGVMLQSLRFR